MKKISILAIIAVIMTLIGVTPCSSQNSNNTINLTSEVDSVSYIIGKATVYSMIMQTKTSMEAWPVKGNYEAFITGIADALKNPEESTFLGKEFEDLNDYINNFFEAMNQSIVGKNKEEEAKFLAENKTKSGVITTESGLQYKILTEGTGSKPKAENVVRVHYLGKLLDGTEFDSSYSNGEPVSFPLSGVIPGWIEGLQLMPVGSKFIFWIPSELAYGENPPSPVIPPSSLLEFEVELLEIVAESE